jgi:long-chain acyl-CoA synthetase
MAQAWTLQQFVRDLAAKGGKPALFAVRGDTVHTMTCGDLAGRAVRLAKGLRRYGIAPGETVGLIAPNGPDWVVARLGLGVLGALVVALDDLATTAELRIAMEDAGCKRILTSLSHIEQMREIRPDAELIVLADEHPAGTAASWLALMEADGPDLAPFPSSAAACLVYTSGTTGRPKAFELTSDHLWANVGALAKTGAVKNDERALLPLPLHHVYPFTIGILTILSSGGAVVFPEEVAGPAILKALALAQVTAVVGVPRLYTALVTSLKAKLAAGPAAAALLPLLNLCIWSQRRFGINLGWVLMAPVRKRLGPSLRMVVSGGALLAPDVLWTLVGLGLKVRTGYGLAETASIFTGNLPGTERFESEGKPFCGEIRIVKFEGSEEGEIQLFGPSVFKGYRNNDEANRDSFTADGWFRTGDVGYLDKDGFIFVTGRIKETLVLGGGKKLHPDELEKQYAGPFMKELAIIERDGVLVALVLPDLEAIRAAGHPRVDDVIRVALSEAGLALPSYERLSGFRIVREPLPKTRLGKFQRFRLRAIYDAAGTGKMAETELSAEDKALLASEPARSVFALLQKRYAGKPVHLDASPSLDLGIDSLEWVSLTVELEQQLGVVVDESEAGETLTLRDLLGKLTTKRRGPSEDAATIAARWLKPAGLGARVVRRVLLAANAFNIKGLFGLTVTGLENVPEQGPFVLIANHESDLDVMMVGAALGPRRMGQLYWAGDANRLFSQRWLHPLLRAFNVFPANDKRASETFAVAAEVLKRGKGLVWFPESWRSPDGELQRFLPGIGLVLQGSDVPVVPAFIDGAFEAQPRSRKWARYLPLSIRFGVPLKVDRTLPPQDIADSLRDVMVKLRDQMN